MAIRTQQIDVITFVICWVTILVVYLHWDISSDRMFLAPPTLLAFVAHYQDQCFLDPTRPIRRSNLIS